MNNKWSLIVLIVFVFILNLPAHSQVLDSLMLFEPSLEDLVLAYVTTASKDLESQKSAPATIYVITEKDIISNGYMELKDALEDIPGVTLINTDFFAFGGQRGYLGNFSQTLLLIDGREVQNLIAAETFISHQFGTHNIKQIEVINGPGSVLYGANALVGVINIITKNNSGEYNKTEIQAEIGTERTRAFNIVFGKEFGDLRISGSTRLYESDEWDFSDFVSDTVQFSEGFPELARGKIDSENRFQNQTRAIPLSFKVDFKGFYVGRESYYNKANKGLENVALDFNGQRDFRRFEMHYVGWDGAIHNNHDVNIEYQNFKEWMNGINFLFQDELWEILIEQNPGRDPTKPLTQEEIHDYFFDVYSQENSVGSTRNRLNIQLKSSLTDDYRTIVGYTYESSDILGIVRSSNDIFPLNTQRIAGSISSKHSGFVQLKKSLLARKLDMTLGGRLDNHSIYGTVTTFRSGLIFSPLQRTYVKGIFGQAFREPNIFELNSNIDLKPATINTFEVSVFHTFNQNLLGNITLFKSSARDFITPSTTDIFINSDDVKSVRGAEIQLFFKHKILSGDLKYANTNPDDEVFAGKTVSSLNTYKHRVIAGINYDVLKHLRLNARMNYYSQVVAKHGNASINETISIDSYIKINVTASVANYEYNDLNVRFQFTVKNLLNGTFYQPNVRRGGPKQFLQPGRQFVGRITFEF